VDPHRQITVCHLVCASHGTSKTAIRVLHSFPNESAHPAGSGASTFPHLHCPRKEPRALSVTARAWPTPSPQAVPRFSQSGFADVGSSAVESQTRGLSRLAPITRHRLRVIRQLPALPHHVCASHCMVASEGSSVHSGPPAGGAGRRGVQGHRSSPPAQGPQSPSAR
jgi:hypothetical protein